MNKSKLLIACLSAVSLANAADAQRLRIGMPVPNVPLTGTPSFSQVLVDSNVRVAFIFQATATEPLNFFLLRFAAATGTPGLAKVSLQTVTAGTGYPTGTVLAASSYTQPSGSTWSSTVQALEVSHDGSGTPISSGVGFGVTRGTVYAIVVEPCPDSTLPCSGAVTPGGTNVSNVSTTAPFSTSRPGFPYVAASASGTWTRTSNVDTPLFGYRSGTATRGFPIQTINTPTAISLAAEHAYAFSIPCTILSTYRVAGVHGDIQTPPTGKTLKMSLYGPGSSGTAIIQGPLTINSDSLRTLGAAWDEVKFDFVDDPLATLACGNTYRIGFAPQEASASFILHAVDFASAQDTTSVPGGTMFWRSTRSSCTGGAACNTTSTAWVDSTVSRPVMELILDDITPPSGGGSQSGRPIQ